jgi:hypothetical protein
MSTEPSKPEKKNRPPILDDTDYDLLQEAAKAGHVKVDISPKETPKERERRLVEESKAADFLRWKEKELLLFTLELISVVVVGCLLILGSESRPESEKKWAMSALALIVGGAVTRTFGREK